jgi:hypothetical protein
MATQIVVTRSRSLLTIPAQHQQRRQFLTNQVRNDAIQALFRDLESNYGNLSSLFDTGPAAETIVADDGIIHTHHLTRLFHHDATALHVRNFYNTESAKQLGEDLIQESLRKGSNNWKVSTSRGLESSDVSTFGEHSPYNVAVARGRRTTSGKEDGAVTPIDEYFEGVKREFHSRRRKSPYSSKDDDYQLWPLDKLRLELDEAWLHGAGLAREKEGKRRAFGGGLPRIMRGPTRWKRGFIHADELGPIDCNRGLFSANIYLTMPNTDAIKQEIPDAGALYIWPLGVRSRLDWYRNATTLSSLSSQDPESQLILRKALGIPNKIYPGPGDLVLLCAQRPHCAVGFGDGVRVSLQCFLQYSSDQRLLIDC